MNEIQLAREMVKEYADRTNEKVEGYFQRTNEAIQAMASSVSKMANTVEESSRQLARYEERQIATSERMERIEQSVRDQGIIQRTFEEDVDGRLDALKDEVRDNSNVRKAAVWLTMTVIAAMIGGGMIFSSITAPAKDRSPPTTEPSK